MGGRGSASMKSKSSSGDNMSTGGHLDPMDSKQANSYLESLGSSNTGVSKDAFRKRPK